MLQVNVSITVINSVKWRFILRFAKDYICQEHVIIYVGKGNLKQEEINKHVNYY